MRALGLLALVVGCNNPGTSATKPPDAPASASASAVATTSARGDVPVTTSASASVSSSSVAVAPPPSKGGGVTLADDVVKQAVTQKQDVLIAKVKDVQTAGAGSRSEQTTYTFDIVKTISGASTGSIKLSAYGAPTLVKDKTYALTTRGGNPMTGNKSLKETVEVPAGQEDATAANLSKKVADAAK